MIKSLMKNYKFNPLFPEKLRTVPLKERESKVKIEDFGSPVEKGISLSKWLNSLPNILAGKNIRELAKLIVEAKKKKRGIIFGIGAHVIKVGLSPIIIDLMENGFITSIASNGACLVHDLEIALEGKTSEDVEKHLKDGSFGVTKETGEIINRALSLCLREDIGLGEAMGRTMAEIPLKYPEHSIFLKAWKMNVPFTVHIAIGTDIFHFHPNVSGEAIGKGSLRDFFLFSSIVRELNNGGVFLNIGSAVIIPEVFLKALTYVRNMGYRVENFTTAVFDFNIQYRALKNVAERPVNESGKGFYFIGHHEILIPLLAGMVKEIEI